MRVLIIEAHQLTRDATCNFLNTHESSRYTADALTIAQPTIADITSHQPNTVILSLDLPHPQTHLPNLETPYGLKIATELNRTHPEIGLLLHSHYPFFTTAVSRLLSSRRAGLIYQLSGRDSPSDLLQALNRIHLGERTITAEVVALARRYDLVSKPTQLPCPHVDRARKQLNKLTKRQREVADLVAQNLSSSQIAARLTVKAGTIERHLDNIYKRLDLSNRNGLSPRQVLAQACRRYG